MPFWRRRRLDVGPSLPVTALRCYGLDPKSENDVTHTSRAVAHEALKRGDVAAIGVNYTSWTNGVRDKDTSTPPGAFRVIARSGDLPNDLLVIGLASPSSDR